MSGDLHGMALRKQLEQKLQEAAQSRKLAEQEMEAARAIIDQAKLADAPSVEAEAALAEATSAYAAKAYKSAYEHAQTATERGKRTLQGRVKSVLDSSATMLGLTKRLGADVSDAEQSLKKAQDAYSAEDLSTAIDTAKKVWKRLEKVLHEHLSSRFTSAQSLIVASKNIGKDVRLAEDLLARARGAVENQDFELALTYTKDCLDNISTGLRDEAERSLQEAEALVKLALEIGAEAGRVPGLIERSRYEMDRGEFEKAVDTAKQARLEGEKNLQRSLELRAADFHRLVRQAEDLGASSLGAQEIFRSVESALREQRYGDAQALLKRAQQVLHDAQFQTVLATVARSREKFVTARSVGSDISGALEKLNQARNALQAGRFREALDFARQADTDVDRLAGEASELMQRVQAVARGIAEGERLGLNTAISRQAMEAAKRAMEQRDLDTCRQQVETAAEELARAEYDRAMESIEQAEFIMSAGQRAGADLGPSQRALEEAISAAKRRDYRAAIAHGVASRNAAESAVQKLMAERVRGVKAAMAFMGAESGSVRSLHEKAEAALGAKDFEAAFVYIEEAEKLTEGKTRDRATTFAKDLRALVELGDGLGGDTRTVAPVLRDVTAAIEKGHYAGTLSLREGALKATTALLEDIFSLVKEKVVEAKSLNLEIAEMRELLKKARMAADTEDFGRALAVLQDCDKLADEAMKLHKETYAVISTVAALIADAKKKGGEVTGTLETLLEAKRAFEAADYAKAMTLATAAKTETQRTMLLYVAGQQVKSAREKVELAAEAGVDSPHLRALLDEAREAMKAKDYEAALTLGQRAERESVSLLREKVTGLLTAAETLLAGGEGAEHAEHEKGLQQARSLLQREDWGAAVQIAADVRTRLESLKKRGEEVQGAVRRAEDLVAEVESMNIEVPASRKLLEQAKRAVRAGQPSQAAELAGRCLEEIAKERDASIQKTIQRFEDALAQARKSGVNTRSAERVLERAKEELKASRYRQALALAMQSEKETERASVQQEMASKAISTAERKLSSFKAQAPHVSSLVADAKRAFEEGDYVLALDLAIRSGDELAKLKEVREDTSEVQRSALHVLEAARAILPDAGPLEKMATEAAAALAGGEVDRGQRIYQQVLDDAVRACGERLRSMVQSAETRLAYAERLGLDQGGARARLAEIRGWLDAENFPAAFEALTEVEDDARQAAEGRAAEVWKASSDAVRRAKDAGVSTGEAEARLLKAQQLLAGGDAERSMHVSQEAVRLVGEAPPAARPAPAPPAPSGLADLLRATGADLQGAHRFGIDVREPERLLSEAIRLQATDPARARALAEQARGAANAALETFAPKLEASLEKATATVGEWLDTVLVLRNVGKALAKDVRVRILGEVEVEGTLGAAMIKAHTEEHLPVRLRLTKKGVVPLAVEVTTLRVLDGKDHVEALAAQIEVLEPAAPPEEPGPLVAEVESQCPGCKGKIRLGLAIAKCECGRDYHHPCAARAGACVACGKPLKTVERKKKITFKLG